jgi:predicted phage terminase large subunit-like protein
LFWEDRFSQSTLDDYKSALGSYGYAGQLQQTPTPLDSGMIHKDWFKIDRYRKDDATVNFVIDPAYTANQKNDPSALLAYTYKDNKWQIIDCINIYKEFPELVKFIPQWVQKNGYTPKSRIFVEPKASGKSIVQTLVRETGLNVKEDKPPTKDKVARVSDISASLESGRVSLLNGDWNTEFLDQLTRFPAAKHDDMVDCLVMAVNKEIWGGGGKVVYFN